MLYFLAEVYVQINKKEKSLLVAAFVAASAGFIFNRFDNAVGTLVAFGIAIVLLCVFGCLRQLRKITGV